MKKLLIPLLFLSACSTVDAMQEITIFNTQIKVNASCDLEFVTDKVIRTYTPAFTNKGSCRMVSHSETNIPHIEYINGMYIFFIENNTSSENSCSSEFTALGITNDNQITSTKRIKSSLSCNQTKELKAFEYFSTKLIKLP